jgi:hypothetical protein
MMHPDQYQAIIAVLKYSSLVLAVNFAGRMLFCAYEFMETRLP